MRTPSRALALAWLPVLAWGGLIFGLSAEPNLRFVDDVALDFVVRKAGHMGVFGILALLIWRAAEMTMPWGRPRTWLAGLALTVLYAGTDELHQGFVNGRHPSVVDVGIDATGAVLAIGLMLVVARALSRRRVQGA